MSVQTDMPAAGARAAAAPPAESADGPSAARSQRGDILLLVALGAIATLLQMLRQPGLQSWAVIWQEDGAIFLTQALEGGLVGTLFAPYNSYLHLVPRILAEITVLFPIDQAALLLTGLAVLTQTLLAFYIYFTSRRVMRTQWASLLIAAAVVLIPAAGYETNGNIANLHWYFVFALFWVLIARHETNRQIWAGAVVTALAVLSDPLCAVLLPLVVLMVWRDRSRRALVIPAVFLVCLIVQGVLGAGPQDDQLVRNATSSWADLPGIYALRVVGSLLVGDQFLDNLWLPLGVPFLVVGTLLVAAYCTYGVVRGDRRTRWLMVEAIGLSVAFLVITLMLRGTENFLDRANYTLNGSRYILLPVLFLFVALVAVLDDPGRTFRPEIRHRLQILFAAAFAGLVLTSFNVIATRSSGPRWSDGLASARQECAKTGGWQPGTPPKTGALLDKQLEPGQIRIQVAPAVEWAPFGVAVDCARLR